MARTTLFFIIYLFSSVIVAQTIEFKGLVKDSITGNPIENATIRILLPSTYKYITGDRTQKNGIFQVNIKTGKYYIEIIPEKSYRIFSKKLTIDQESIQNKQPWLFNILPYNYSKTQTLSQISGTIRDKLSNKPLDNVLIQIIDPVSLKSIVSAQTKANGIFSMQVPPGNYKLNITGKNYISITNNISVIGKTPNFDLKTIYLNKADQPSGRPNKQSDNIILPSQSQSDKLTIKGTVLDAQTREPLSYVPLRILDTKGAFIQNMETNEAGQFSSQLNGGQYTIQTKTLGYKEFSMGITVSKKSDIKDSINILLESDAILLNEAIVTAKVPDIRVKGDTIEYNAQAYTRKQDILLQDILKNIPGIQISPEGTITINNKPVHKILIDGKEFFGNDIQLALKNIPVEIIKNLQVYNKESDLAKASGIKDPDDNQILDLEIKDEFKKSIFGNAQLGYGNNNKYYHKFMVNYLGDDNQLTLLGNMNNINDDEDGTGAFSDGTGVKTSSNIGGNFNYEKIDDLKIESNIIYDHTSTLLKSNETSQIFLYPENRNKTLISEEKEDSKKTKLGSRLSWEPKSALSAYFNIEGMHEDTKNDEKNSLESYVNKQDTTRENSTYSSKGKNNSLSSALTLGFKLNDEGRNLSLQLNGTLQKEEDSATNLSITDYSNKKTETLDQKISNINKNSSWGGTLSYTEPFNEKNILTLSYSFNQNNSDRSKNVFKADPLGNYTTIDSTYTRHNKDIYRNHMITAGFQSIHDKYEYYINLSAEPTTSKSRTILVDSLIQKLDQNVVNYNGSLRFSYKPKTNIAYNIDYSGMINQPNVSQLSTDTITENSMNKTYGNPHLKSSSVHNLSLQYQKSDITTGRFIMFSGGFNYTMNQISAYTKIDSIGNTETTYKNVNGNWGGNFGFLFNMPLKDGKFTIDNNTNAAYYESTGFINDEKSQIKNISLSEYLSANFNSEIVESSLQLNASLNLTRNSLPDQADMTVSNYGVSNNTNIKLPYGFGINNNISYTRYAGYTGNFNKSQLLWSASLTKLLFRNKGLLKLNVYDILNNKSNIIRTQTSNEVSDTRTNSMRQYILLSFLYRFNLKN